MVPRKVVNDFEKFFPDVSFNVAGEGWIEPHDFSCSGSVFPRALAGICGRSRVKFEFKIITTFVKSFLIQGGSGSENLFTR